MDIDKQPDRMIAKIPATSVDSLWYRTSRGALEVDSDLRRLYSPDCTLDERAIYSLLQFGAVIPPLSVWKEVRRTVPGRNTILRSAPSVSIQEQEMAEPDCGPGASNSLDKQREAVLSVIDQCILDAARGRRLVILFSGGVDSGLLAARAAALGLKDTVLVNYSFGVDDAESILAEKMAQHLGLKFWRVNSAGSDSVGDVLQNAGRSYREPFCDHSTVPTYALVQAVKREFGAGYAALDGTGADGAFGMGAKAAQWQRVDSAPMPIRVLASMTYEVLHAWKRQSAFEHRLRLLRRARRLPYPLAAVAQNPLDGIAYRVREGVRDEVISLALDWLNSLCPANPPAQLAALDMALVCACIFAQKSKSPFDASEFDIVYPFLSPPMFRLALAAAAWKGMDGDPKWLLKDALARSVPHDMVYRPKSGFAAPASELFRHPAFIHCFKKLARGVSPMEDILEWKFFRDLQSDIEAGKKLPPQTANLVWGAVFCSEWISQVTSTRGYLRDGSHSRDSVIDADEGQIDRGR